MNKITVNKIQLAHRPHSIIHQYKISKKTNVQPISKKPEVIKNFVHPNKVLNRQSTTQYKREILNHKPISINQVKPVSVISKPQPNIKSHQRAKSNFDSQSQKINLIKGVGSGKILAIFAPGPSILEAKIEKLKEINKIDTMTINKPDPRVWETKYWMFCDRTQYDRNRDLFHSFSGTIINTESMKPEHPRQVKIKSIHGTGFSTDMIKGFYIGRSSTFSSMQIAAWMGYEKIFIFGCDMARVNGKLHSYGVNPDVPEKVRESRFEKEAAYYNSAANIMNEELRNKFYFCSSYNPWPFIDKYKRLNQVEAVDYIIECANQI